MMLLIDSGNSRIKVGVAAHDPAADHAVVNQLAGFDNGNIDALRAWLTTLPRPIASAWGVNVAGTDQQAALDGACAAAGITVAWHTAQARMGRLINGYTAPERLGADRWAAIVGVVRRQPEQHPPVIVATFGTATTIDVIDPDNVFLGGMILPGPSMMRHSLNTGTAGLPLAIGPPALWPTDTDSAIASGVAAAQAGALARQVLAAHDRWQCSPIIYAAGGGWLEIEQEVRRVLSQLAHHRPEAYVIEVVQHPVLDGLARIATLTDSIGRPA